MANSKSRPSTDIPALLLARLERHIKPGQCLCVALSGGVDSVVLLHAAKLALAARKDLRLVALHVHHGLSPNADAWEDFCKSLCERLDISLQVRHVSVIPTGEGLEAAARMARHAALRAAACDWVLLGHHREDQAETLLLNLLRGTGVHGAAAMAERRDQLLRPMLEVSRQEILDYAKRNGLSWIEDESNIDGRFSRNFLRHQIIPLLEHPFPQASASLARAAQAFAEASRLLDQMAQEDGGDQKSLRVSRLAGLSESRATNLLTYYLRHQGLRMPSSARLKELLRQLLSASSDNAVRFSIDGREVRLFRDRVVVEAPAAPISPVAWSGESSLSWGGNRISLRHCMGEGIAAAKLCSGSLRFAPRRAGDALRLRHDGPRRPLKDLLREAGIPPWHRDSLPVFYSGQETVWVAGVGIAAEYRCLPGAEGVLIEFDGVTW